MVLCACGLRLDRASEPICVCKHGNDAPLFVSRGAWNDQWLHGSFPEGQRLVCQRLVCVSLTNHYAVDPVEPRLLQL